MSGIVQEASGVKGQSAVRSIANTSTQYLGARNVSNAPAQSFGGGNINNTIDGQNTTTQTLKRRSSLLDVSGAGIN